MIGSESLKLLLAIADRADEIALKYFRAPGLRVTEKAGEGPVTPADLEIEQLAREMVARSGTGLGILGEELGELAGTGATRFIIDPIDATENFIRGIPIFAVLLAIEAEGEVVASLVSAPALGARWWAERGGGALRDGHRLRVSDVTSLPQAQLFHCGMIEAGKAGRNGLLGGLVRQVRRERGYGDFYQHMLVAEGAGEIAVDLDVAPWDVAPIQLIVEEAGGRATTLRGERSIYGGSLISSNGKFHDEVLAILHPEK